LSKLVISVQSNQRLIDLADNLLRVCKIEEGKVEIKAKPVHLENIVEQIIKKLSNKIKEKELNIIFKKPKKLFPKVSVDPDKIKHVLLNILDNAIVYNYVGGQIMISFNIISADQITHLKTRGKKRRKYIQCSIFNTGVGIPQGQLDNIFTKFFRANNVITVHTEGNGLDLFVAKSYTESHKGKIWAESEGEGKGATFYFILPL